MRDFNNLNLSRRGFNQKLATGLGAVGLFGLPVGGMTQERKKLGVALVGLGNYSRGQLAPALLETKNCELRGLVSGSPEKAGQWAEKYNVPEKNIYNYQNYDQIADNDDIDIVYVVLPNSMHAEYTIRAAQAGKHVLCEKPMAVSVEECRQMIDASNKADRKLSIGYRLHFEPHNQEAARLGQQKVFGDVKLIEANFGFKIGDPTQWRLKKALAGGGALMDVGIYCIQASRYVTGEEPLTVTAQEYKTDPVKFAEVDETMSFQLTFPSGAVATCNTSYATSTHGLYVGATDGWFSLKPAYTYGPIHGETKDGKMDFPQVNHQAIQMDSFSSSILEDKANKATGEEGLRDLKVIEGIFEAIRTGSPVELNI